ncbi:hepatitis A virus cellular receptor 1 homolog [Scyliorhinus torazame]|uniref:hepatitis A virus cellular receptor 1 homolog n=1 Tax=Scyliorhinus torazame TaxID=75743 RepID=UPI003B594AB5
MPVTEVVSHLTVLILILGPVTFVRGSEVRGFLGQSVTLPCSYSVRENGETGMCWGRGWCPAFSCSHTLIRTNGRSVTLTISPKYHLDGKLEEGNVSLTVADLGEEDNGWYCCRVEIPGIFNDQKMQFNLLVLEGHKISTRETLPSISPNKRISTQLNSPVPEVFAHTLISPISLAFHVSVLICFVAITVLLCQWKCQYPAK